jgi:hypothetical protein
MCPRNQDVMHAWNLFRNYYKRKRNVALMLTAPLKNIIMVLKKCSKCTNTKCQHSNFYIPNFGITWLILLLLAGRVKVLPDKATRAESLNSFTISTCLTFFSFSIALKTFENQSSKWEHGFYTWTKKLWKWDEITTWCIFFRMQFAWNREM